MKLVEITVFIAANTRQPATGGRVFELAEYFEMVYYQVCGFPRASHIYNINQPVLAFQAPKSLHAPT